jgi:hypothetical protein
MRGPVIGMLLAMLVGVAAVPSAALARPAPAALYARVVKRHGAAIHEYPGSEARVNWVASCNDLLFVTGQAEGWWQVSEPSGASGWVGGARVVVNSGPAYADCSGAYTFQIGGGARVAGVQSCLSLRHWPARDAPYDQCVPWGYYYQVVNGPIDVAGEDWLEVYSPEIGSGWSLADYLVLPS